MHEHEKPSLGRSQKAQEVLQNLWSSLQRASEVFTDECSLREENEELIAVFQVVIALNSKSRKLATSYIRDFLKQEGIKARKVEWGPGYLRLVVSRP